MPIPSESLPAIETAVNRLAAETVLATPGRDDGLIPAYSLLNEIAELCAGEPALLEPVKTLHGVLDKRLDNAQPFDAETLGTLARLVEWLPQALQDLAQGRAPRAMGDAPAASAQAEVAAEPEVEEAVMTFGIEDNRELLTEFHSEAVDHLQQIEAALLVLDQEPDEPEALASMFRSFHTIKGNAGFLGLVPMHTLAHEVETLLDLARNRKLRLNSAIITEILRSRDALQALTQQVARALETGTPPTTAVPVSHLIRAVNRLAVVAPVETNTIVPLPGSEATHAPAAEIESLEEEPVQASETLAPFHLSLTNPPMPLPVQMASASPAASATPSAAHGNAPAAQATKGAVSQTVRVTTDKLDSLMDVVGELVIVQSQLVESSRGLGGDGGSPLQRNVSQLTRITKELQHTAMSLRMIPVKPIFQKMERLARDLARDFGKRVSFLTDGEDTELDRTVVEEIGDPLVHMVRNALDHGLESAADRLAHGKPEMGTIHLRAYHQGSNIVIELQDDGRGIDPEKVLAKARKQNLIAENAQLSREEIYALIFLPGFSTAEKITAVSGRGVGMDVVKRNIEKLRGKIEIVSEVGQGSTFKIKLPLTMAIIDGLVVGVGGDRFILPSTSVQMAMRPAKESIVTVHGTGEVLDLRGKMLPLHRLHRRFGIAAQAEQPWDGIVVIVETSGKVSALLVDELISKQEVVIKNLGAFMQNLPGVAGGAILGDGNIALILDPASLLQAA